MMDAAAFCGYFQVHGGLLSNMMISFQCGLLFCFILFGYVFILRLSDDSSLCLQLIWRFGNSFEF